MFFRKRMGKQKKVQVTKYDPQENCRINNVQDMIPSKAIVAKESIKCN